MRCIEKLYLFVQIHGRRRRPPMGRDASHVRSHVGLQDGPQGQPQNCVLGSSQGTSLLPNYIPQCVEE